MEPKKHVKRALEALLSHGQRDAASIAAFFAPGYRQCSDGRMLDFDDFVAHMQALDRSVTSVELCFKALLEDGDQVASRHVVHCVMADGHAERFEVIAVFRVGASGILSCHELTRQIEGQAANRHLGARVS